jgi:Myb DNA-binding like
MYSRLIQGLSYFGTDFELISLMFPALTRSHLKLKFKAEERKHPERITEALRECKVPDDKLMDQMRKCVPDKKSLFLAQFVNPPSLIAKEEVVKSDTKSAVEQDQTAETDEVEVATVEEVQPQHPVPEVQAQQTMEAQTQKEVDILVSQSRVRSAPTIAPRIAPRKRRKVVPAVAETEAVAEVIGDVAADDAQ